jgi:hypothetical protein
LIDGMERKMMIKKQFGLMELEKMMINKRFGLMEWREK